MITPIRGRKLSTCDLTYASVTIRNDNPDKGTETLPNPLSGTHKNMIRNDNPDKGTETNYIKN